MTAKPVLVTTYPEAFLHKGGGEYELLEIALNLRKLGIVADAYSPYANDLGAYETVIHFSVNPNGLPLVEAVKQAGKKLILWPNFWINETTAKPPALARFLELADIVVFKSTTERNTFDHVASLSSCRTLIVPVSVDPIYAASPPKSLFQDTFALGDYIVWVGIIEPCKNQLEVIHALREVNLPVVFIGNYRDEPYYQACKEAAPEHFLFLGPMEHKSDILRAAIRESRLYIEPALEPAGKSVLEAAISGARILVSDAPWEREHLGDFAVYVDPKDPKNIRAGVQLGLTTPVPQEQTAVLSQKHLLPGTLEELTAELTIAAEDMIK